MRSKVYRVDFMLVLNLLDRVDARRKVLAKTASGGKVRLPGKPCGATFISPSYNCNSHFTNGKLNAQGKKQRKEYISKVRAAKGLKPSKKGTSKGIKSRKLRKMVQAEMGQIEPTHIMNARSRKTSTLNSELKAFQSMLKRGTLSDLARIRYTSMSKAHSEELERRKKEGEISTKKRRGQAKKNQINGAEAIALQLVENRRNVKGNSKALALKSSRAKPDPMHVASAQRLDRPAAQKEFESVTGKLEKASQASQLYARLGSKQLALANRIKKLTYDEVLASIRGKKGPLDPSILSKEPSNKINPSVKTKAQTKTKKTSTKSETLDRSKAKLQAKGETPYAMFRGRRISLDAVDPLPAAMAMFRKQYGRDGGPRYPARIWGMLSKSEQDSLLAIGEAKTIYVGDLPSKSARDVLLSASIISQPMEGYYRLSYLGEKIAAYGAGGDRVLSNQFSMRTKKR